MADQRTFPRLLASWRAALIDRECVDLAVCAVAAERAITRCLFLRLAESRGLLPTNTLAGLSTATDLDARLLDLGRQLAGDQVEDEPTTLSRPLRDAPLRAILKALATPGPPHHLEALPLAILGQAHEYLRDLPTSIEPHRRGERTRATARKTNGIYFTPPAVVTHLIPATLNPLLCDRTLAEIANLTILDPACGAGVFLVGAYRHLLDWHRDRYLADCPQRHPDALRQAPDGTWQLSATERRRILLAHIHGVDRDPRAVELTRLALLLVTQEGGPAPSLGPPPDLSHTIRCGDALIGPDIRAHPATATLDAATLAALRPFDWPAAFPAIMARGGFDVVLGNPPYLSYAGRQAVPLPAPVRAYLLDRFANTGWPAAHTFFIARAVRDLARHRCAFIVPDQVGHLAGYAPTRALLARQTNLVEVRYWGEAVFADATTPTLTFIADRAHDGPTMFIEPGQPPHVATFLGGQPWQPLAAQELLKKLREQSESLGALVGDPGVHTGNCARHLIVPTGTPGVVPVLEGRQIGRYRCAAPIRALRLDYAPQPGEYRSIRPPARYTNAPFVIRQTAPYPIVGPRLGATYFRNSLLALYPPADGRAVEYLVGLLNSSLLRLVYTVEVRESRQRAFPQVKVGALRRLPIRRLDLHDPRDRAQHDAIVASVRQLLALHAQRDATREPPVQGTLDDAILHTDRTLDRRVYALYNVTDEEAALLATLAEGEIIAEATQAGA